MLSLKKIFDRNKNYGPGLNGWYFALNLNLRVLNDSMYN